MIVKENSQNKNNNMKNLNKIFNLHKNNSNKLNKTYNPLIVILPQIPKPKLFLKLEFNLLLMIN